MNYMHLDIHLDVMAPTLRISFVAVLPVQSDYKDVPSDVVSLMLSESQFNLPSCLSKYSIDIQSTNEYTSVIILVISSTMD